MKLRWERSFSDLDEFRSIVLTDVLCQRAVVETNWSFEIGTHSMRVNGNDPGQQWRAVCEREEPVLSTPSPLEPLAKTVASDLMLAVATLHRSEWRESLDLIADWPSRVRVCTRPGVRRRPMNVDPVVPASAGMAWAVLLIGADAMPSIVACKVNRVWAEMALSVRRPFEACLAETYGS